MIAIWMGIAISIVTGMEAPRLLRRARLMQETPKITPKTSAQGMMM